MINDIMTASGIPFRHGRYPNPPAKTYAVVFDDITTDGPDGLPRVERHDGMVELYAPTFDPAAEAALEAAITAAGLQWTKQAAYWLQNVQRYQTIYEFTYYTKRRA